MDSSSHEDPVIEHDSAMSGRAATWAVRRVAVIAALLVALSVAHFLSSPHVSWIHDLLFKATYLPIVLAALWFGLKGGLATAFITSVIYTLHIRLQLAAHHQHEQAGFWLELVLYWLIAAVVGHLSDRQKRVQENLEETNVELAESIASLREKTEALLVAEESLRRADRLRAVGELAAGIAHEVRNPLGGILGAANILADPTTAPESRTEFAAVLAQETRRLDSVISRLLDLARPVRSTGGTADLAVEIGVVERLTTGARTKAHAAWDATGVPPRLIVRLSPEALRHVILNLTLNALAALPPQGGRIDWAAHKEESGIRVTIADNGGGISPDLRDRLFEPFVTTGGSDRTGLGLAIVSRILAENGGTIGVVKTGSEGTAIAFTIPSGEAV